MRQRNLWRAMVSIYAYVNDHRQERKDQVDKRQCKIVLKPLRVGTGLRSLSSQRRSRGDRRGASQVQREDETHLDNKMITRRQPLEASQWAWAASASSTEQSRHTPSPPRPPARY